MSSPPDPDAPNVQAIQAAPPPPTDNTRPGFPSNGSIAFKQLASDVVTGLTATGTGNAVKQTGTTIANIGAAPTQADFNNLLTVLRASGLCK